MKINNSSDFGKMLKQKRKELNLTQGYVAEVTGFSASFISNLENGKETCEIGKAIRLANTLGLDILLEERIR